MYKTYSKLLNNYNNNNHKWKLNNATYIYIYIVNDFISIYSHNELFTKFYYYYYYY